MPNKKRSEILLIILVFITAILAVSLTSGAPGLAELNGTFFDGFESNSFETNNWTDYGTGNSWKVINHTIKNKCHTGQYCALGKPKGGLQYLEINIDTAGYSNITFSYYKKDFNFFKTYYCSADWYNGTDWIELDNAISGRRYIFRNYSLLESADNNPYLKIRFKVNTNNKLEKCYIDDIQVKGFPIPDTTPPSSVTSLINQSQGITWIYWTWTNPEDIDFNKSIIYINDINIANTSNNYYNATELSENTEYLIIIHTKDITGNINYTNITNTAKTLISCTENWTIHYTECNASDQNVTYYTDENSCGTTYYLPEDNGTNKSCNYCTENITGPFNTSCISNQLIQHYIDANYAVCCAVTNLTCDCNINNGSYDNQTFSCGTIPPPPPPGGGRSSEKPPKKTIPVVPKQEEPEEITEEKESPPLEEIPQTTSEKENLPKISGAAIKSTSGTKPNSYYAVPALLVVILLSTIIYIKKSNI